MTKRIGWERFFFENAKHALGLVRLPRDIEMKKCYTKSISRREMKNRYTTAFECLSGKSQFKFYSSRNTFILKNCLCALKNMHVCNWKWTKCYFLVRCCRSAANNSKWIKTIFLLVLLSLIRMPPHSLHFTRSSLNVSIDLSSAHVHPYHRTLKASNNILAKCVNTARTHAIGPDGSPVHNALFEHMVSAAVQHSQDIKLIVFSLGLHSNILPHCVASPLSTSWPQSISAFAFNIKQKKIIFANHTDFGHYHDLTYIQSVSSSISERVNST